MSIDPVSAAPAVVVPDPGNEPVNPTSTVPANAIPVDPDPVNPNFATTNDCTLAAYTPTAPTLVNPGPTVPAQTLMIRHPASFASAWSSTDLRDDAGAGYFLDDFRSKLIIIMVQV